MLQAIYRGEEWDSNPRNRPGSRRLLPNAFGDKPKVAAAHHAFTGSGSAGIPAAHRSANRYRRSDPLR
jgi:hypothetical protein